MSTNMNALYYFFFYLLYVRAYIHMKINFFYMQAVELLCIYQANINTN